jgi:hypothetical protein
MSCKRLCIALVAVIGCGSPRFHLTLPEEDASAQDSGVTVDATVETGPSVHLDLDAGSSHVTDAGSGRILCPDGGHTTISGTTYAPNGSLPLYNVIVFTPVGALPALGRGATCEHCGTLNSAKATATALSDSKGHFVLVDPTVGTNVRLAVQIGKWRRVVTLPKVTACVDNPLTDPNLTRLPANRGEGDMPRVGVTTGGADHIPCMLPKVGIDPHEFGVDGTTAVTLYQGSGGSGPMGILPAKALWNNLNTMMGYDLLIFSCEGSEEIGALDAGSFGSYGPSKDANSFAAMTQYLTAGGRIFGTDFMYTVWKDSPDPSLADAAVIPGGAPPGASVVYLNTTFAKGRALADWLFGLDPSQPYGTATLNTVYDNITTANLGEVQVWGGSADGGLGHPRFMTANTPVGAAVDQQCGKAVHLDAHVNVTDAVNTNFPGGCTTSFSTAEKAFGFFFFDLAACIQQESAPPQPPPPTEGPPM